MPQVAYKKNAKANLSYTTVVDRPDIQKATQAAKLISEVGSKCCILLLGSILLILLAQ